MKSQLETFPGTEDGIKASVRLENLFDSSRIQLKPKLYKAILYLPIALPLLLVRLFAGIGGILILSLLPKTSKKRSGVLKKVCKVLGLFIEVDNKYVDENAKVLVANHVSLLDRIAVNVMTPSNTIAKDFQVRNIDSVSFWKDTDAKYTRDLNNEEIVALQRYIEVSPIPVLHFPESATTNGQVGLLKFHPGVFSLNFAVQPVLIRVSLSSFMTVSPTVLGSTAWADVLWSFMLPSAFFTLKTLPSMVKLPNESVGDFSERVQRTMALAMDLNPTIYTSSDKAELVKRLQSSSTAAASSSSSTHSSHTPGILQSLPTVSNVKQYQAHNKKLTMNTAAETFGKSPKVRMASYQERKAMLLEAARMKYLEKRNNS